MYGSIGVSLFPPPSLPLPPFTTRWILRRDTRLSNISAGRRFLRRVTYIPRCVEERVRSHGDHRDEIYYMFPT